MINDGNISLNEKNLKNLYIMNNQSNPRRNNFPIMLNNTNPYNCIYYQSPNKIYNNINTTDKKNIQYPSYQTYFNNSNNYYLPSTQKYFNEGQKSKFILNSKENTEKELLIRRMKDLINQKEKKKEKQIIKDYYAKSYMDMIKKNIDSYPNGINLSISNCETQYPINSLNDNDDFFRKLKIFLDNYEQKNTNNNNNINKLKSSYDFYSKILKKNDNKFQNMRNLNDAGGEILNTYRQDINNKLNYQENYNKTNNNLSASVGKINKDYSKTCNNFRNIKKSNDNKYKDNKNNYEKYDKENNTIGNIDETPNKTNFNNNTKSRIKLMNIENKRNEYQNLYKKNPRYKNIRNKSQIIGKDITKEYELQEKYIAKIKLFIEYIESFYILSLNKFFRYFIKNLHFYGMQKLSKNKDCNKLLKRFQKTRNINYNNNSIFFNNSNNKTINSSYNLNRNKLMKNYGYKNRLYFKNSINQNNNVSPEVYIPKNKMNKSNVNSNKTRRNIGYSSNISYQKDIESTDNKTNLSTDYKSKKIFNSNEKFSVKKNNNLNKKEPPKINNELKNHIKNFSSVDFNSKNDTIDKIYSRKKPIVYLKPKSGVKNLKKIIISREKEINNNKTTEKNIIENNSESLNNGTNNINDSLKIDSVKFSSLLFKNENEYRSPIKSISPIKKENQKYIYKTNKTEINNSKIKVSKRNITEELVVKNIVTYDRRLWVTLKYISSDISAQNFFKIKIKRRLLNVKDNKNIFENKGLDLLQPTKIEYIEIIPIMTSLDLPIQKSEHKITIIPEEKEDINVSNKILEMMKIIQKIVTQNIYYFYKYFFNNIKKVYNIFSQKKIFINIQNNFKKENEINISKISNNIIEDNINENELDEDNNSDNNNEINNRNKNIKYIKRDYWKRNLFPDIKIHRLNTEYNIFESNETLNNLNKSDIYERSEFSDNTNTEKTLNISEIGSIPKKNSFRLKIIRYKISRERIGKNKKIKVKKDILKEDEEMRKKNKMIFLLTNKFSYYNNCLRLMKNYFNIWKNKDDNNNTINNNININDELKLNNDNIQVKEKNINDMNPKINKEVYEIKEEDNESNIDNLSNSKDEGILKINELISNNNEVFNLTLKALNKINNEKEIQIDSIQDSEENKSNYLDKNELEEKIDYFRMYLINNAFKRKNLESSEEEEKEE